MRRFGFTAALVLSLLFSGLAFVYYGVPRFIRPELVRAQMLEPLEMLTAGSLTYKGFSFSYFPKFKVAFADVRLKGSGPRPLDIHADRIEIEPDSFPLLIRQFRVRHLKIEDADVDLKAAPEDFLGALKLRGVTVEALPLGTLKAMRIRTQGRFEGTGGKFEGDLRVHVASFSGWHWHDTALQGAFQAQSGDLNAFYRSLQAKEGLTLKSGTGEARIQLEKEKGRDWLSISGDVQVKQLVYACTLKEIPLESLAMDSLFSFESTVDTAKSEWVLRRSSLKLPPGTIELSGQGNYRSGEIQELRLSAPEVQLEQVPNYFVAVKEALPFNIGFSGLGQIELSLKGTADKLAVYLNTDLKPSVLTYGGFLDKPKGVPFSVVLDAMIQQGNFLTGDLSVRFNEVLAKGTLKDLNLATGAGQLNLITNKHPAASWGPLVPALRDFELGGNIKMLTNWEGDLHHLDTIKKVFNLTIDDGSAVRKDGSAIKEIRLELDYDSVMGLVVKQIDARAGKSLIQGQVSVYNPAKDAAIKTVFASPDVDLPEVLTTLHAFFADVPEVLQKISGLERWAASFPPASLRGKNFALEAELKAGKWQVEKFGLDTEGGRLKIKGSFESTPGALAYEAFLEINKAGLGLLFPPAQDKELCRGELFVNGRFSGKAATPGNLYADAQGGGSILISKAEFLTFDLREILSRMPDFSALQSGVTGQSRFEDVRGHFQLENGKFVTEDLVFLSPDFLLDAKGEMAGDGQLNLRLELYLSRDEARKVLGAASGEMGLGEGEWFGPVPLILTGTLAKPEIQADSQIAGKLLNRVQRGNSQGAFRNFLREDALFEARSKN